MVAQYDSRQSISQINRVTSFVRVETNKEVQINRSCARVHKRHNLMDLFVTNWMPRGEEKKRRFREAHVLHVYKEYKT